MLLTGLPGVGKSRVARCYAATRAGVLNLDIDVLRTLLGGRWDQTAELGRMIALELARSHLERGADVIIPQRVARADQLRRFEAVAEGFSFSAVLLQGPLNAGDEPWQASLTTQQLQEYRGMLGGLVDGRDDLRQLDVVPGDPDETARRLARLLETAAVGEA